MKKSRYEMAVMTAILAALMCAGCYPRAGDTGAKPFTPVLYTDPDTGCQYLTTGQTNAFTPRIDSDGLTHRGCRKTDRVSP